MEYFVIGDEDTVLGFSLAGVKGQVVFSKEDTEESLESAINRKGIGIIIITERIADMVRDKIEEYTYKLSFPLIIEIPDRNGAIEGRASINEIIKSAVGISI